MGNAFIFFTFSSTVSALGRRRKSAEPESPWQASLPKNIVCLFIWEKEVVFRRKTCPPCAQVLDPCPDPVCPEPPPAGGAGNKGQSGELQNVALVSCEEKCLHSFILF